jgi:hypothetical protein
MSDTITITIPAIDPALIEAIKTETTITESSEANAIRALREKFYPLAKHAGYIRIARLQTYESSGVELRDDSLYYEQNGRKVRALLALDDFGTNKTEEFRGVYTGSRLYLTEAGEWLQINRVGSWSQWQGSPQEWNCGTSVQEYEDYGDYKAGHGSIEGLNDTEIVSRWKLAEVAKELGKSLATMAEKLPERLTRIRQRSRLAAELLAALK